MRRTAFACIALVALMAVPGCGSGSKNKGASNNTAPAATAKAKTTATTTTPKATPSSTKKQPSCKSGNVAAASLRSSGLVEVDRGVVLMPPETREFCDGLQVHATWFEVTFAPDGEHYNFKELASDSDIMPGVGDQPAFIDGPQVTGCNDTLTAVYVGSASITSGELPQVKDLKVTGEITGRLIAAKYLPALADC